MKVFIVTASTETTHKILACFATLDDAIGFEIEFNNKHPWEYVVEVVEQELIARPCEV